MIIIVIWPYKVRILTPSIVIPGSKCLLLRGAFANGATEIEIRETLLQTAVYCGVPTGMASFRVAEETIRKLKDEGRVPK